MPNCLFPLCKSPDAGNGLCVNHGRIYKPEDLKGIKVPETKPVVKAKPIAKRSKKMQQQDKQYKKILAEMRKEGSDCELKVQGVCTGKMEGAHHMKKRGVNYLNRKYMRRACNACNQWCESHPLEAVELGLSLSKHKVEQ